MDLMNVFLRWFKNYLSDHQQQVVLDHVYSDWATVLQGVPQGSVLGPLLFIIYMNDLPDVISHSHLHLFADDIMYASGVDAILIWFLCLNG